MKQLQIDIGYEFSDQELFHAALTHSSAGGHENYERLEFLGDRVLGLVMAEWLYRTFPGESEGALAKRHAALVQGPTVAEVALSIDLGRAVILSDAERAAGGADNENILADAMEGLIGAAFLDGGLAACDAIIRQLWDGRIHSMSEPPQDSKTALQEWTQGKGLGLPSYTLADKTGPDHAPQFLIELSVEGHAPVRATGPSRRAAEKAAAAAMLQHLRGGEAA